MDVLWNNLVAFLLHVLKSGPFKYCVTFKWLWSHLGDSISGIRTMFYGGTLKYSFMA